MMRRFIAAPRSGREVQLTNERLHAGLNLVREPRDTMEGAAVARLMNRIELHLGVFDIDAFILLAVQALDAGGRAARVGLGHVAAAEPNDAAQVFHLGRDVGTKIAACEKPNKTFGVCFKPNCSNSSLRREAVASGGTK